MSSQASPATAPDKSVPKWLIRVIAVVLGIVVLVIAYFILAAFVPRWWAQRIGSLADQSIARGITWGLFFGFVCTFVPLLLLLFGALRMRRRGGRYLAPMAAILALIVAAPNLMTLTIVWGTGGGAHAGERILDVDGPGFRGATLTGAVVALLVFLLTGYFVARYRKRGKDLRRARNREGIDSAVDAMERSERNEHNNKR
ncbi:permease [Skermania piniformis]|uniref:Permease n=1 Tax=Skermania pinensis TaxID=39122 RepID=A0ABX8S443_9ACTN|nr:permease [Skermania piniformis]QXQ12592.1 permease [Skermania piniformis]